MEKKCEPNMGTLARKLGFPTLDHLVREFENYLAINPYRYRELKKNRPLFV